MQLSDPEHVQHVLVGNAANYTKQTRGYRTLRLVLGDGLVTSEGEHWRRQRRIAQPAFHKERINGFAAVMSAAALDTARGWRGTTVPVDVAAEMYRLTLRVAGETLFSQDVSGDSDVIGEALGTVIEHFRTLVTLPFPWPELLPTVGNVRFWRARHTLDRVVSDIIAQRRRSGADVPDLLGMFMAARDEETGEGMTDVQLRDEVLTMLLAGHETTANTLAWTLYLLAQNRDVAARLEAEVDAVLGDRAPTPADLRALTYTQQVIKESMRLYPPVWALARKAAAEDVIDGWRVPANTFVFMCQHIIQRHPDLWPDPERFDPDRFAPGREPPNRFAYFPFSRGQRMCIGDRFAELEAAIILPVLVRRFRFEVVAGHPVVPEPSITLRPRHGIRMHLRPRA
jgi:cytochrome P450